MPLPKSLADQSDDYQRANNLLSEDLLPQAATFAFALVDKDGFIIHDANESGVTAYTPVTTDTISANVKKKNETIYLTPAGTIAAATFVFPSDALSRIGQILRLVSTQIVSALTVTSTGLTLKGTAVTALAVNTPVSWQKVAAATWMRL